MYVGSGEAVAAHISGQKGFELFLLKKVKQHCMCDLARTLDLPFQAFSICATAAALLLLHHRWPNCMLLPSEQMQCIKLGFGFSSVYMAFNNATFCLKVLK